MWFPAPSRIWERGEAVVPSVPGRAAGHETTDIRSFLIADVRGYTLFTLERGDEAAATLAARFATLAREEVEARGGRVLELRGDEALAVFGSARQAIRAAVGMQQRFVEETLADPSLPLPVGIGLDAGEAVPIEGGYRGGALNLAARLCGAARAGEILASREIVHLARKIEGVRYLERGEVKVKGMADPVGAVRVVPEAGDPAREMARFAFRPPRRARSRRRTGLIALVVVAAVAAAAIGAFLVTGDGNESPGRLIRIDPSDRRIVATIPIGGAATAVAVGEGAVWVGDGAQNIVARIDPDTNRVVSRIRVYDSPGSIVVGEGAVWVATKGALLKIDPVTNDVTNQLRLPALPTGVAAGFGMVWVTVAQAEGLLKITTEGSVIVDSSRAAPPGFGPNLGVTVALGALWTSGTGPFSGRVARGPSAWVERVDPQTLEGSSAASIAYRATDFAVGEGAVWLVGPNGAASRIDLADPKSPAGFSVPKGSSELAVGGGYVWVANPSTGRVQRLAAETGQSKGSVLVGKGISDLAVDRAGVWVTVSSA